MYYFIERLPVIIWYNAFLITGIVSGYYVQPPSFITLLAIIVIILCWMATHLPHFIKKSLSLLACLSLGYALIYHQIDSYHTTLAPYYNSPFSCTGTVIDYTLVPHLALRHKILIALDGIRPHTATQWQKISGYTLVAQTKKSLEHLVGMRIKIDSIMLKSSSPSFTAFCIRNKIFGSIHKPTLTYETIASPLCNGRKYLCNYKNSMINYFKKQMNRKTFTLFSALFLGNNDFIKKTIKPYQKAFQNWGIIHYLARSGLHLVIITILFEYLLFFIPWTFSLGRIMIILCATLYGYLTWPSLSFYRAFMIFLLSQTARIARKAHHFLHILLLVCFCFLLINPITLFFLDFQLTFGITLALSLFNYAHFNTVM